MMPLSQVEYEALAEAIHIRTYGLDVPFEYAPWMDQLGHVLIHMVTVTPEISKAYDAGCMGHVEDVEAFVGGFELAQEEGPKLHSSTFVGIDALTV